MRDSVPKVMTRLNFGEPLAPAERTRLAQALKAQGVSPSRSCTLADLTAAVARMVADDPEFAQRLGQETSRRDALALPAGANPVVISPANPALARWDSLVALARARPPGGRPALRACSTGRTASLQPKTTRQNPNTRQNNPPNTRR